MSHITIRKHYIYNASCPFPDDLALVRKKVIKAVDLNTRRQFKAKVSTIYKQ